MASAKIPNLGVWKWISTFDILVSILKHGMVTIIDAKDLVMAVDPNIGRSRLIDYDYDDDDDDSLQERMVMV